MKTDERRRLMEEFSDMCDQAKSVVGACPYVHTNLDFHAVAEKFDAPRVDPWKEIQEEVDRCGKCKLCGTRNHTVFGEGALHPW
jgi:spermidine synthase